MHAVAENNEVRASSSWLTAACPHFRLHFQPSPVSSPPQLSLVGYKCSKHNNHVRVKHWNLVFKQVHQPRFTFAEASTGCRYGEQCLLRASVRICLGRCSTKWEWWAWTRWCHDEGVLSFKRRILLICVQLLLQYLEKRYQSTIVRMFGAVLFMIRAVSSLLHTAFQFLMLFLPNHYGILHESDFRNGYRSFWTSSCSWRRWN